jgi:hypothetical protein
MNSTLFAIDPGQLNCVFCCSDPDARTAAFHTAATARESSRCVE